MFFKKMNNLSCDKLIVFFRRLLLIRKIFLILGCLIIISILFIPRNIYIYIVLLYFMSGPIFLYCITLFNNVFEYKIKKLELDDVVKIYDALNVSNEVFKDMFNPLIRLTISRALVHFHFNEVEEGVSLLSQIETNNSLLLAMKYSVLLSIYGATSDINNFVDIKQKLLDLPKNQRFQKIKQHMEMLEKLFIERECVEILDYPDYPIAQLEKYYFQGINFVNQHNLEKAKESFEKIKNECSDLYYVQEAKKYLMELNSK